MRLRLMHRLHRPVSPVARAISLAFCWALFLCMLSFILFEVLDIDGSDFPKTSRDMVARIGVAEAEHDIRRVLLTGREPLRTGPPLVPAQAPSEGAQRPRPALHQSRPYGLARPRAFSILLPRAALPDPSHRS